MTTATSALWSHLARTHLSGMGSGAEEATRIVVSGTAGSGKSTMLRHLRRQFLSQGRVVHDPSAGFEGRLGEAAADSIVVVDDAHALSSDAIDELARRLDEDPSLGVVLALRPWPQSDALRSLVRRVESARPPVVLGHLSAGDVHSWLTTGGRSLDARRIDAVLELCGHVSWLTEQALRLDSELELPDANASTAAVADAMQEVIAHRLQNVDPLAREAVERICVTGTSAPEDTLGIEAAYAEGLLQRNGTPPPIVRMAVIATISAGRMGQLLAFASDEAMTDTAPLGLRGPRLAAALLRRAETFADSDPARADALFDRAVDAGADAASVSLGRARSAWAAGRIDMAALELDRMPPAQPGGANQPTDALADAVADLAASIWAARGLLERSHAIYESNPPSAPEAVAHAVVAAVAVGAVGAQAATGIDAAAVVRAGRRTPSTLDVSLDLLVAGLRESLGTQTGEALGDVVRAAEMYSASGCTAAAPEIPAVIAAVLAAHVGELDVAAAVLADAVRDGHGGSWATDRLLLWTAWIAMQRERPHEMDAAIRRISTTPQLLSARDRLLWEAVAVGRARRYGDAAALQSAWRSARDVLLRARFDLFTLLPLAEFVVTAARLDDLDRVSGHFARAVALTDHLGGAPLWSVPLHWAGIQRGILSNDPESLKPHARALLAAAGHSRSAATMAQAGRVWTSVLAGKVDADAVEAASLALAEIGMAWDGARLAGHGAARTDDRRAISRLLSCARQLHPRDDAPPPADGVLQLDAARSGSPSLLSPRERDVAVLVLQGKTYAEIGEAIFISPRTAEHHIARIRQRLGASSRSDLMTKLRAALADDEPSETEAATGTRLSTPLSRGFAP